MGIDVSDIPRLGRDAQAQIAAKLAVKEVKRSKYGNVKTTVDGIKFDSIKEANRYVELMSLWRAGKIRDLKLQPQFTLQESYITPEGERVRAIRYVADFSYEKQFEYATPSANGPAAPWVRHVEDVKSSATRTPQYMMKRKMMRKNFGIEIEEV